LWRRLFTRCAWRCRRQRIDTLKLLHTTITEAQARLDPYGKGNYVAEYLEREYDVSWGKTHGSNPRRDIHCRMVMIRSSTSSVHELQDFSHMLKTNEVKDQRKAALRGMNIKPKKIKDKNAPHCAWTSQQSTYKLDSSPSFFHPVLRLLSNSNFSSLLALFSSSVGLLLLGLMRPGCVSESTRV
jgi:hypothetical protein